MIVVEMTSDEARLWKGMRRIVAQQEKMERGFTKVGRSGQRAGDKSKAAFATGPLKSYVAALVGVGGITMGLRSVIGLFDKFKERAKGAGQELYETETNMKKLLQISGTQAEYDAHIASADQLVKQRGIPLAEALGLEFKGASVGFTSEQVQTFGSFKEFSTEIAPLIDAVGGLKKAFGSEVAGGTIKSTINALLVGAKTSKAELAEIAEHVLRPAQAVKRTGGNAPELVATLGVIGHALKSTDEAATQIRAMATELHKNEQLRGKGLLGGVEALSGMSQQQRDKVLTNVRAASGYGLITQNLAEIHQVEAGIREAIAATGTPGSKIQQARELYARSPELVSMTEASKALQIRRMTEQRRLGAPELTVEAVIDTMRSTLVDEGAGPFAQQLSLTLAGKVARFVHEPKKAIPLAQAVLRENFPKWDEQVTQFDGFPSAREVQMAADMDERSDRIIGAFTAKMDELISRLEATKNATLANPDSDPR